MPQERRSDRARRGESRAQDPGRRDAVVGVRQLGHPLQGVRPARCPARPLRETGRRGEGARVHRRGPDRRPAHPVGPGRGLRRAGGARREAGRADRRDQLQHLPGRRLQAGQHLPPRRGGAPEGRRPPAGVRRHHGRHRLARPEAVVRRRHELPGTGRHPVPAGPAGRGPGRGVRAARRGAADAPGVQALRAGVLHDGRAGLGHGVRALSQAGREGPGRGRHGTPRAGHEHRVHRGDAAAGGSSAGSTSTRGSTPTTT